ncbi:MAG: bifunctional 4-hydroxy-2-oxoglutarate aldolase/2-dehydro-3-deoxy-phosphogluconate aldolase [Lautropia sp.]
MTSPSNPINPRDWLVAPVLPVVVINDVESGLFIADAFLEAGLGQIEVTLRSAASLAALAAVARRFPQLKVSAGTVLVPEQVAQIRDAGATLAVSPGFTPALADAMRTAGMPWIPGVATAGEVMRANDAGYSLMKFFPAMAAGGPPALAGIASAIKPARGGDLHFIPTGGVTQANLPDWKATGAVIAVGGTWLTRDAVVAARDRAAVVTAVRDAIGAWNAA